MSVKEIRDLLDKLNKRMKRAAAELDFETAAELRDRQIELKKYLRD